MPASFPSFSNVYIPNVSTNAEITANLVAIYGRGKGGKWPYHEYVSIVPTKKPLGYFRRVSAGAAWRINPTSGNQFKWAPGNDSPSGAWNKLGFVNVQYDAQRYAFATELDLQTVDVADFKIQPAHFGMLGQQANTWRSYLAASQATDSTQYPASHVATATSWGGGLWSDATGSNTYIHRGLMAALQRIQKSTGGMVRNAGDFALVMNPTTAAAVSRAEEIREYLARQEGAWKIIEGQEPLNYQRWSMPQYLYGTRVVIEDTVKNDDQSTPLDSTNSSYVWPDGTIALLLRPDGQIEWPEGVEGNPSVVQMFSYEEMNSETETETWHRRVKMRITDYFALETVAHLAGALITSAV